ncbi:hypothetical protein [Chengkuizengella axinellae]|uniref:Uncharacterized protein n=1 Tax=Chengkuizengella axinellae TaxID=3064388 RepID=A0ABT9J1F9_9BACL|nr:hypothetical protein [Chengkuizengella sp. 2205SS18-9]MDP5275252.1 hypothetical protein [Chengkuizengella sp. 2205SS18-9]
MKDQLKRLFEKLEQEGITVLITAEGEEQLKLEDDKPSPLSKKRV